MQAIRHQLLHMGQRKALCMMSHQKAAYLPGVSVPKQLG